MSYHGLKLSQLIQGVHLKKLNVSMEQTILIRIYTRISPRQSHFKIITLKHPTIELIKDGHVIYIYT